MKNIQKTKKNLLLFFGENLKLRWGLKALKKTPPMVTHTCTHLPIARIGVHCNSNWKTVHSRIQYHTSHRGPQIELLYQMAVPVSPV